MRKIICLILVIVTVFPITLAHAVEIDLSKYTDEELKEILELLNEEMLNRKIVKSATIPVGRYTIGVDIPSGKYVIEMADKSRRSGPIVKIYEDSTLNKTTFSEWLEGPEDTMIIELNNGNVLETDETIFISTFVGITFE